MELDGRSVSDASVLEADLCIVGGGLAGMALAWELAGSDIKVLVLESAGRQPDDRPIRERPCRPARR